MRKIFWIKILLAVALCLAFSDPGQSAVVLLNKVGNSPSSWSGLSTDVKPTTGNRGSTFYEENTGIPYIYGSSGWVIDKRRSQGGSGSGLPSGGSIGQVVKNIAPGIGTWQDEAGGVPTSRQVNGHALNVDVTVSKGDVGLGNCDNTSDANKPVSSAQQSALDAKLGLHAKADTAANADAVTNGVYTTGAGTVFQTPITNTLTLGSASQLGTLVLGNGVNAYTVTLEAGATSASYTLILPPAAPGGANYVLTGGTNGATAFTAQGSLNVGSAGYATSAGTATSCSGTSTYATNAGTATSAGTCTGNAVTVTNGLYTTGGAITGNLAFSGTSNYGLSHNSLTTTQRDALSSIPGGAVIWNSTTSRVNLFDGSAWHAGWVRLDGDTMTGNLIANSSPAPGTIAGTSGGTYYPSSNGTSGGTKVQHFTITALTGAAIFALPPGTWNDGDRLVIRIYSAAAQTLDFTTNSTVWRAGTTTSLPTTTTAGKTMYCGFIYNSAQSIFDIAGAAGGF